MTKRELTAAELAEVERAKKDAETWGRTLFEAQADPAGWAAGVLGSVIEIPIPEVVEVYRVARDPELRSQGHDAFDAVRRSLLDGPPTSKAGSLLLTLAELVAKVAYNATPTPAPFDADSGWWIGPVAASLALELREQEKQCAEGENNAPTYAATLRRMADNLEGALWAADVRGDYRILLRDGVVGHRDFRASDDEVRRWSAALIRLAEADGLRAVLMFCHHDDIAYQPLVELTVRATASNRWPFDQEEAAEWHRPRAEAEWGETLEAARRRHSRAS